MRSNLGAALTLAGEFEEAQQVLEETLALRPFAQTYSSLGVIHYYMGNFEKSVESHRRAAELTPSDDLVWLNLADALHFAGLADGSKSTRRTALL